MLFGWAAVVLAAYFLYHKPLPPQLVSSVLPLAAVAGTVALGWALGRWLIPVDTGLSGRGRLALAIGGGLGLLGFLQLGLAAAHVFSGLLGWGLILGALTAVMLSRAKHFGLSGQRPLRQAPLSLRSGTSQGKLFALLSVTTLSDHKGSLGLALFCGLALGAALLRALAPPAAWDALVYHLMGPKLYLAAGGLTHDLDLPYLGFPHWGEMLFLWAVQLGGDRAAAVMHWVFAPLTLMLLPDLLRPAASGRAWLAAAILLSTTTTVLLVGWPYVEWMMMFAVTAGALALGRWQECGKWQWVAVAGLMGGLAFGAKYTAVGAVIGLGAGLMLKPKSQIPNPKSQNPSPEIRDPRSDIQNSRWVRVVVFGAATIAAISPWLLKNYVLTGNPVYPFFFPGKYWDAARAFWYSRGGTGLPIARLLVAPWEMTVQGMEGASGYGATLGPLLLILLPAMIIGWQERPAAAQQRLRLLLVIVSTAYAVWLAQVAWSGLLLQSRLLLGVFPILACLAAAAFDGVASVSSERLHTRWLMGAVVALVLFLTALEIGRSLLLDNPMAVLTGTQTEADYLRQKLGWYALAIERINELPQDSRVAFLWEPRSYHCRVTCLPDALLDRWWHLRQSDAGAGEIAARWKAEGLTHVLIFEAGRAAVQAEGFDPITAGDWAELEVLRAQELELAADFGGVYQLYEMSE